jgi:hypothetical protein
MVAARVQKKDPHGVACNGFYTDEILTDPRGDFEGFRSINVRTFEAALSKVE